MNEMRRPMTPAQAELATEASRRFLYLFVAMCVALLAWMTFCRLDIVSEAEGEVIPSTRVKRVQHLEGGIIRELLVREGDRVQGDQPLVVLDSTPTESNVEELDVRINALRMEIAILEADDQRLPSPVIPSDIAQKSPELVQQSLDHFRSRRSRMEGELTSQREKVHQREKDIEEISARLRNQKHNLDLLREQIAISESLLKDQLTTKYKHLNFLQEETSLRSRIEEDTAAHERANAALAAARGDLEKLVNGFQEETRSNLKKAQRELLETQQRLRKSSEELSRTVIRAPGDGVVKNIYVVNVGEVVKPGMTILDIVPAGDRLVVEAHLPIQDIGYVKAGQRAIVKLASRDARRFGALNGSVKHVSPDAMTLASGATFYRVLIETEQDHFQSGGDTYQLYPGMRVLAGVHTGTRSVLAYVLDPFLENLGRGMQER